jgi:phage-related protein (TIGR01555 family)
MVQTRKTMTHVKNAVKKSVREVVDHAIEQKKRLDGWTNILTGLGKLAKDARVASEVKWTRMAEADIEHLYAGDAMAAKVADLPIEEATNKGYVITGISKAQLKKLRERLDELRFDKVIIESAKKGRVYGGAGILRVYDDDLRLERPLPDEGRRPIKALVVFNRFEIPAYWEDVQKDLLSPDFGCPIWYTCVGRRTGAAFTDVKIHTSRITRFEGAWLPDRLRESNNYWGDSVFSKTYDAIRNYAFAHDSVNAALKDLSVGVFKMKNLADQIAADCDEKVLKRIELVNLCKSIARAVVLDAEGEDFEYKTRTLTGAADLVDRAEARLAAETDIPRTVLLGESPQGGLGQTGNHEADNWANFLEAIQTHHLKPKMLEIIWEVAEELGIDPEKVDLKFNPLKQMSAKDEVEMRSKQADTDLKYIGEGVLSPSEVRESRFAGDSYSVETVIDKSLEADDELQSKQETTEEEAESGEEGKEKPDPEEDKEKPKSEKDKK